MTELRPSPKEIDAVSRAYVRAFMKGLISEKQYWALFAQLIKDIPKVKECRTVKGEK